MVIFDSVLLIFYVPKFDLISCMKPTVFFYKKVNDLLGLYFNTTQTG